MHHVLQVFPDAHPRARKSQVRISENTAATTTNTGGNGIADSSSSSSSGSGGEQHLGGLWRDADGVAGTESGTCASSSSSSLVSNSIPAPFIDVVLEAGDAIYIPAFWFHHCEAVGASASINVFSDSHAKLQAQMMLSTLPQSLPKERHELHPWLRK